MTIVMCILGLIIIIQFVNFASESNDTTIKLVLYGHITLILMLIMVLVILIWEPTLKLILIVIIGSFAIFNVLK